MNPKLDLLGDGGKELFGESFQEWKQKRHRMVESTKGSDPLEKGSDAWDGGYGKGMNTFGGMNNPSYSSVSDNAGRTRENPAFALGQEPLRGNGFNSKASRYTNAEEGQGQGTYSKTPSIGIHMGGYSCANAWGFQNRGNNTGRSDMVDSGIEFSIRTQRENNTLDIENYVDASTEEVFWLSTYTVEYRERTSTQTM
jgi:hypothetical protein